MDEELRKRLVGLLSTAEGLSWAYLFGSAARDEPRRDVDVAVMPRQGAKSSLVGFGGLRLALSNSVGEEVDLVDLSCAPLPLLGAILRDRVVLLDRDASARHDWEARTVSRWLDFEPVLRRCSDLRREALAQRLSGTE